MTLLLERTAVPLLRSVAFAERLVEVPEVLRLVVLLPVDRLVRSVWVAVPVERLVVEPVLRLVVLPVDRLVRSVWAAVPVERLVVEPVLRVVVLPVERFVRSF